MIDDQWSDSLGMPYLAPPGARVAQPSETVTLTSSFSPLTRIHYDSLRRHRGMGNAISKPADSRYKRSQGADHPQPTLFPPFARDALERLLVEVLRGRRCQPPVRSPGGGNGRRRRVAAKSVRYELHPCLFQRTDT